MIRKFGPKSADHPSIGRPCPACGVPFAVGDYTTLVPLGPGNDREARRRRDAGRTYNSVAAEVHWDCGPNPADSDGRNIVIKSQNYMVFMSSGLKAMVDATIQVLTLFV